MIRRCMLSRLPAITTILICCILFNCCRAHKKSPKGQYLKEDLLRLGKTNQDILNAEQSGAGGWTALLDCCQPIDWVKAREENLPSSVCEKIVTYPTIQYCGLHQAIDNANADYAAAGQIIHDMNTRVFQEARNTSFCAAALLRGICAYHFWLCSAAIADSIYNDVCLETCDFVSQECAIPLSKFTGLSKSSALHLGCRFNKSNQFTQDCTSNSHLRTADLVFTATLVAILITLLEWPILSKSHAPDIGRSAFNLSPTHFAKSMPCSNYMVNIAEIESDVITQWCFEMRRMRTTFPRIASPIDPSNLTWAKFAWQTMCH